jgi:hypothetical protein
MDTQEVWPVPSEQLHIQLGEQLLLIGTPWVIVGIALSDSVEKVAT